MTMEKYHCVRVYPNGEAKETVRDATGMKSWLNYNRSTRGNALFVNGHCEFTDHGGLKAEAIKRISVVLKEELVRRVPLLPIDLLGSQQEFSLFGSFSRSYRGYRPEPDRIGFRQEIEEAEKEYKLLEAEQIEKDELNRIARTKTPETDPDHSIIGHDYIAYCGDEKAPANFVCDSYDPRMGFWMTRQDAPEDHKQDQQGKWRRNISERTIDRTFHHNWTHCRHKHCQIST